ncbi:hypothetical protein XACLG98_910030 [Xanthomonas citri pv. citri]|nr:hypothetical protein XACLG98_910030 [Xanthomonas citri pv. citri]
MTIVRPWCEPIGWQKASLCFEGTEVTELKLKNCNQS